MSRLVSLLLVLAVVVVLFTAARNAGAADPAAAKAAAKELLEKGWDKTAAAREVVADCDLNSQPMAGDFRVALAHWLALMNHNQYDKALDSLKAFFECKPPAGSQLIGLRAKAWIEVVKKNYVPAMKTAESLAQAVGPSANAAGGAVPAAHAEAIAFLGHLAAFLEGPVEKNVDQSLRKKWEATVLARFDEPRKKAFDEAKAEVADEFQRLIGAVAGATDEDKADDEAEKQKKLAKLAEDKAKLEKNAATTEEKEKLVQEELKKTLAELERRDGLLVNRLTLLQNNLTSLSNQATQYQANADRLNAQAAREQNATSRQRYQFDAQQAMNTVSTYQTQMDNLRIQMNEVTVQRNALQQMKQQALGGANIQDQLLQQQQKQIEKEKLRNENKQKREQQGKSGANTKTLVFEVRARSFSSYDTFPLEELRETLLKSVK
jgi:hypothetical protein